MVPGRTKGRRSFITESSNAGLPTLGGRSVRCRTPVSLMPP